MAQFKTYMFLVTVLRVTITNAFANEMKKKVSVSQPILYYIVYLLLYMVQTFISKLSTDMLIET